MMQHLYLFILLSFTRCQFTFVHPKLECERQNNCIHTNNSREQKSISCFCQEDNCWLYDDCCHGVQPSPTPINVKPTCQQILNTNLNVYVVDSCPADWWDENDIMLCLKEINVEDYHYTLDLPYQSKKTQIIYANIYCAKCNDDYTSPNQINFKLEIACTNDLTNCKLNVTDKLFKHNYTPGNLAWYLLEPNIQIQLTANLETTNIRSCHVIKQCATGWKDERISKQCQSYTSYVESNYFIFKNVYCAYCNYETNVTCAKSDWIRQISLDKPDPKFVSYVSLLDFSIRDEMCSTNEIFDLISDKCIPTLCGKYYEKIQDRCVPKFENGTHNSTTTTCSKIPISINDLDFYANGSIKRKESQKIYTQDEYERFNSTIYLLCIESHDKYRFVRPFPYSYGRLTIICMCISLICLAAHILIHFIMGKYKNIPGKNLLSLSLALFIAQLLFFIGIDETEYKHVCFVLGVVIHFFYLAVFFWMNVMAFDIYKTFARSHPRSNQRKTFYFYTAYAWLTPLVIVSLAVIMDLTEWMPNLRPIYGYKMCWISSRFALFIYFALPLAILLVENIILFSFTANGIHQTLKVTRHLKKSSDCKRFHLYLKLAFIMGGTWIFGLAANLSDYQLLWYGFVILNASQGTFIFVVFTLKKGVLRNLCERVTGKIVARSSNSSSKPIMSGQASNTKTSCLEDTSMLTKEVENVQV